MPLPAGEHLGPSSGVEEASGRAAVVRGTRMLLSKCLEAPGCCITAQTPSLWHCCLWGQRGPQPPGVVSLLIISTGCPFAAVPPSIIFGCPRSVRPELAAPPAPHGAASSHHPVLWWVLPSSLPSQTSCPIPKGLEAAGGHPVLMPGLLSPTASPCSAIAH